MRQHNIWCACVCVCACVRARACVRSVWRGKLDESSIPFHTEHTHAHTHTHQMLCCRITTLTFYIFKNFKISDFNKEHTRSLKMI